MKRILISFMALTLAVFLLAGVAEPVFAEGTAPVAENLELTTYRNTSVGGCLSAYDPEGDAVSFEITTQPVKGCIELKQDGSFIYTPGENKKGRDYFGYKAIDTEGNYSQEATVIIKIEKQKKNVFYRDMAGRADEYAAVALSENGLFTGEQVGGIYCFYPDKTVSRGEFLSMCMVLSGEPVFTGVLSTGYADDQDIPVWMKGYVATAVLCGIDYGRVTDSGSVFDASAPISKAEAASMLDSALHVTSVSYIQLDENLDAALAQACVNLSAHGILKSTEGIGNYLTRSDAAQMLAAALELQARR